MTAHSLADELLIGATGRAVVVHKLGTTSYDAVLRLQRRLQAERREGSCGDTLLLTEHRPVLTLGRSHPIPSLKVPPAVIEQHGIQLVQTERGGDITYHGPGQLVAYGIIDLKAWDCTLLDYAWGLEETVIQLLADYGIAGERVPKARGVWVASRKIASLGLNVRRWVTMHGIALNVDPDMSHFDLINPCGMPDVEMTSMVREAATPVRVDEVAEAFVSHFRGVFHCTAEMVSIPGGTL